jgi:cold shock CspA family protein
MNGTMLWFNIDKGYGFIRGEDDEQLYVETTGFLPGHLPEPRCRGRHVSFERQVRGDESRAVNVAFVTATDPRRARLRRARGGSAL